MIKKSNFFPKLTVILNLILPIFDILSWGMVENAGEDKKVKQSCMTGKNSLEELAGEKNGRLYLEVKLTGSLVY